MTLNVTVSIFPKAGPVVLTNQAAAYELREGLGEISELSIELLIADPDVDMGTLVGETALVQFADEPFLAQLDGIVRRVRQLSSEPTGVSRYELLIVPPIWLATRRTDHRIFQDQTVPEIVSSVLAGYRDRIPAPSLQLTEAHAPLEYCVQYGETDADFIHRILADAGISGCFLPAAQGVSPATNWTLVDDTTLGKPVAIVPFVPPSNLSFSSPHVSGVFVTTDVETSVVTVRDYDFRKPEFILERTTVTSQPMFTNEGEIESYSYEVGRFEIESEGDARARQLLEEARSRRRLLQCTATFALAPGSHLRLSGHPRTDVNGDLVVVRARTLASGRQAGGQSTVTHLLDCIPAADPFRPPRRPKPRIHGTQTAFVVTEQADVDEIDVDELGRVKVEFRWDRRDLHEGRPTRRIRVSQGWAGPGYGLVTLPRVGEEVIVAYLDGDPDQPIIVGRVHNGFNQTPLKLPEQKTQSVWRSRSSPFGDGFNQILMDDALGAERLELRAERDFKSETLHDSATTVGHDQTVAVVGAQSVTAGSHSTSAGTIAFSAGKTLTAHAGSDMTLTAKGKLRAEAPVVMVKGKAATSVHAPTIYVNAGTTIYVSAGVTIEMEGGSSVSVKAPTINVEGSTVNVEGSGTVNVKGDGAVHVKGGTVNLNC